MLVNNLVIVGGPIAVGKSVLIKQLPFKAKPEFQKGDILFETFLEYMYTQNRVSPLVYELYFLSIRKTDYLQYAKKSQITIFDRSLFESLWFAKFNIDAETFPFFEKLWEKEVNETIEKFGRPKLYVLLTCSWTTFKERIFKRGRAVEINNFDNNKKYFKEHILTYEKYMIKVLEKLKISYVVLVTDNKTNLEVAAETTKIIAEN